MAFRSTPYRSAQKSKLDPVNDGPLRDFCVLIEDTSPEQWQIRTQAFQQLVSLIPSAVDDEDDDEWYNSPKHLKHMLQPLSKLLKDPRSSVVKSVCLSLSELFDKCRSHARLLLKDLIPVVLDVHGQTIKTIRASVETCMVESLPKVPCRAAMPTLMERLSKGKSASVKEASCLYLTVGLESWNTDGYLSQTAVIQVGVALVSALGDASPAVRRQAKRGITVLQNQYPEYYQKLLENPDVSRDARLQKWLLQGDDASSVTSGYSRSSYASLHRSSPMRSSPAVRRSRNAVASHQYRQQAATRNMVPTSVVVGGPSRLGNHKTTKLGPPVRVHTTSHTNNNKNEQQDVLSTTSSSSPSRSFSPPTTNGGPRRSLFDASPPPPQDKMMDTPNNNNSMFSPPHGLFLDGVEELKRQAKKSRSRRSSLLQEKFRLSSSNLLGGESSSSSLVNGDTRDTSVNGSTDNKNGSTNKNENTTPSTPPIPPTTSTPNNETPKQQTAEHVLIAKQVLQAHQTHVDSIMETLRLEMDSMKDFESLLTQREPSEEEVVTYFDCIGLCLDQRTASGRLLQREMNRISGVAEEQNGS